MSTFPYAEEIKTNIAGFFRHEQGEFLRHDHELLQRVIEAVKKDANPSVEFDKYCLDLVDELADISSEIGAADKDKLPIQTIHYDLHPHNVLFNAETKELIAILDFDPKRYSQRERDVGLTMQRFARTCGSETERQNDAGVDNRLRAKVFLEAYDRENELSQEEQEKLPLVVQDEAMKRVINCMGNHYLNKDTTWSFDLPKQVITLKEAKLF